LHQKEFIGRVGSLEEFRGRLTRFLHLRSHAATRVEYQPDGYGCIFALKICNFLLRLILKEPKMALFQTCDEPIERIGDGYIDENQGLVDTKHS
jgi:hypothetical protein